MWLLHSLLRKYIIVDQPLPRTSIPRLHGHKALFHVGCHGDYRSWIMGVHFASLSGSHIRHHVCSSQPTVRLLFAPADGRTAIRP